MNHLESDYSGDATVDNEAAVLGALLTRPDREATFELLASIGLEPIDFEGMKTRAVFEAMRALEASGRTVDLLGVEAELERMGKLIAVGGVSFLVKLATVFPMTETALRFAAEVKDRAVGRRVAVGIAQVLEDFKQGEKSGDELLNRVAAVMSSVEGSESDDSTLTVAALVKKRMRELKKIESDRENGRPAMTGFPTGVAALDKLSGGYQAGIVTIIAARPGMGKSSFINAGCDAISLRGDGVHLFSMEDSSSAVGDRLLSKWSEVPAEDIRAARVHDRDARTRFVVSFEHSQKRLNWIIDNRSGRTAAEIVRSVRKHRRKNNTKVVFVDYITLLRSPDKKLNEEQSISANMQTLAEHAKADDLAYVVAAQLNREIEKRSDKRPTLSDLRGSGRLEEMCRSMIGLYRGSYYADNKPVRNVDWQCKCHDSVTTCDHKPEPEQWKREAQLCLLKNSGGQLGQVTAGWDGPTMRLW